MQAILDYEVSRGIPPGWVNTCISKSKPNGFWHRLERGEMKLDHDWYAGFNSDLHKADLWKEFYSSQRAKLGLVKELPPLPEIDGEWLFWDMMKASRTPDPWMLPALKNLAASNSYLLAALSNTVIFPPDHPYASNESEVHAQFSVFISSAHVGLRKPDPAIYKYTISAIDTYAREHAATQGKGLGWEKGIKAQDILFLDDIGENLKAARGVGMRTLKVGLGKAYEAVEELEQITGMKLAGNHPKVAVLPKVKTKL